MDKLTSHSKGEKVTAKAHGGTIDITGITIATVDEKVRMQAVDTYFDPLDMFRQIAPHGVVNKQVIDRKVHSVDMAAALDDQASKTAEGPSSEVAKPVKSAQSIVDSAASQGEGMKTERTEPANTSATHPVSGRSRTPSSASSSAWEKVSNPTEDTHRSQYSSSVTGNVEEHMNQKSKDAGTSTTPDEVDRYLTGSASRIHPHPKDMELAVRPDAGEAVVAASHTEETRLTHEEMSRIMPSECPFLMNRE